MFTQSSAVTSNPWYSSQSASRAETHNCKSDTKMILKKKIWTHLKMGMFLFAFTVILRSVFLQVQSFSAKAKNCTKTSILSQNVSSIEILISSIANVSAMEPLVKISDQCQPADLTPIEKLNCSQHPGLSGRTYPILELTLWHLGQ